MHSVKTARESSSQQDAPSNCWPKANCRMDSCPPPQSPGTHFTYEPTRTCTESRKVDGKGFDNDLTAPTHTVPVVTNYGGHLESGHIDISFCEKPAYASQLQLFLKRKSEAQGVRTRLPGYSSRERLKGCPRSWDAPLVYYRNRNFSKLL